MEVLARLGKRDEAASRVAEFAHRVADLADPRVPGLVARCRALVARCGALVATGSDSGSAYRLALSHHQDEPGMFVVACTRLLYGEWKRRQGERRASRDELGSAFEVFEKYGAAPLSERGRGELRASGAVLRLPPSSISAAPTAKLACPAAPSWLANWPAGERTCVSGRATEPDR